MTNPLRCVSLGVTIGLLGLASGAVGRETAPEVAEVAGAVQQVIVRLHSQHSIHSINAAYRTRAVRAVEGRNTFLLDLPPHVSARIVENRLRRDRRVAWAEMNHSVIAPRGGTQSFFLPANFGVYMQQYSMELIEADAAGEWSTGAGQIIAVLDTGIDPEHEMIVGHIAPGGYNYIDDNNDFTETIDENDPESGGAMIGHGTMVSGLILRIAPSASILPMRVLNDDGVGTSFYVAQAIYDAIEAGASVINLSLGTITPSQAIADAVQAAHAADIVVIATAGNSSTDTPPWYPAAFDTVIAVAGTNDTDHKASFSDFGQHIDLSAPAVSVVGTFPNDQYASSSGNSFATALVSGAAAVLRAHAPGLSAPDVRIQLRLTADDIDAANPDYAGLLGSGRLNIRRALAEPVLMEPEPQEAP